ncbi:MAG: DNA polymerase III subunit gamma/tau, partial [Anaerolineaceae bacterium]|nr:DNA polymerase III subunit gamma/tau [Anaerolineaceae bacterium]
WRPHLWDEVVSQEHIVQTLRNAIRSERVGHAYLFAGPRGTGKTSTARLLAKAVNCADPDLNLRPCDRCANCQAVNDARYLDLIEIDAASNTSVEDVRDLRDKINFSPSQGRYKVYIIDEVHMLSTAAFNALLKTLEEPPKHAIFILATTEVHKIPATVLSRCQRHEFRRIPVSAIVSHLNTIVANENLKVEPEVLTLIARQSTGALRDAISLLDQLATSGENITLETAQQVLGTATSIVVITLIDALLSQDAAKGLDEIHTALDAGSDPRQFARQVVEYLRGLLLIRMGNPDPLDITTDVRQQMEIHAQALPVVFLLESIRLFNTAATETRSGWQPALLLEMALAEAIACIQGAANPAPEPALPAIFVHASPVSSAAPAFISEAQRQSAAANQAPTTHTAPSSPPEPPQPSAAITGKQSLPETQSRTGGDVQVVQRNWDQIRAAVRAKSKPTGALLNSVKKVTAYDGALVLGYASKLLKEKMDMPENLNLTRETIIELIGIDVPITCEVISGNVSPAPAGLDEDGIVGTALNLGGQIVYKE